MFFGVERIRSTQDTACHTALLLCRSELLDGFDRGPRVCSAAIDKIPEPQCVIWGTFTVRISLSRFKYSSYPEKAATKTFPDNHAQSSVALSTTGNQRLPGSP